MRIAHLDTGREWRGGQNQVLLLLRGLRARDHETLLLAPEGPLAERARTESLPVASFHPRTEWDPVATIGAARALRRFAPEVAHAHSAHAHAVGVPAARLARVPAVVVSRRVDFLVGTNPLSRLKYGLGVDRYLCISRGVQDALRASGIPERRLALVPSGIDLSAVREGEASAPTADLRVLVGALPGAPVIGTVAALAPHKNHADLLRAAAIVARERPEVRFAWLGEGECRPALERQREALGLTERVHLLGFRPDARALMRQFTVFALSSYLEGLCTSLLDAQAAGVPIVATAVGGIPDVVTDGATGRLVAGRDPEALARALIEAVDRPDLRDGWARGGLESVRAFGADRMVERTLEVYRDVLAGRSAGA